MTVRQTRHFFLFIWTIFIWIISAINPLNFNSWLIENIPVVVFIISLLLTYKRFTFTTPSYFLMTIFLTLHLIGAHYTYVKVPMGYWLMNIFDFSRNHYDRIVHFSFGLLFAYPVLELLSRSTRLRINRCLLFTPAVILSFAAFFELLEWFFLLLLRSETIDFYYIGAQGDIWDSHQDMLLAFLGAAIAILYINTNHRRFLSFTRKKIHP